MSMLIFSNLVQRAKERNSRATTLLAPVEIKTTCNLVLFLNEHINLLEEQLSAHQQLSSDWKAEAKRTQRQLEAVIDAVTATPAARETLLKLIAGVK